MAIPSGYNPLRYDCVKQGCFNTKMRPKIELFCDCFPGLVNFSDVDGIVELNRAFLMLEWKSHDGDIPKGQRIMFERMTNSGQFAVCVVHGNAETMEVYQHALFYRGKNRGWQDSSLEDVKRQFKRWAAWAREDAPVA